MRSTSWIFPCFRAAAARALQVEISELKLRSARATTSSAWEIMGRRSKIFGRGMSWSLARLSTRLSASQATPHSACTRANSGNAQ